MTWHCDYRLFTVRSPFPTSVRSPVQRLTRLPFLRTRTRNPYKGTARAQGGDHALVAKSLWRASGGQPCTLAAQLVSKVPATGRLSIGHHAPSRICSAIPRARCIACRASSGVSAKTNIRFSGMFPKATQYGLLQPWERAAMWNRQAPLVFGIWELGNARWWLQLTL